MGKIDFVDLWSLGDTDTLLLSRALREEEKVAEPDTDTEGVFVAEPVAEEVAEEEVERVEVGEAVEEPVEEEEGVPVVVAEEEVVEEEDPEVVPVTLPLVAVGRGEVEEEAVAEEEAVEEVDTEVEAVAEEEAVAEGEAEGVLEESLLPPRLKAHAPPPLQGVTHWT